MFYWIIKHEECSITPGLRHYTIPSRVADDTPPPSWPRTPLKRFVLVEGVQPERYGASKTGSNRVRHCHCKRTTRYWRINIIQYYRERQLTLPLEFPAISAPSHASHSLPPAVPPCLPPVTSRPVRLGSLRCVLGWGGVWDDPGSAGGQARWPVTGKLSDWVIHHSHLTRGSWKLISL